MLLLLNAGDTEVTFTTADDQRRGHLGGAGRCRRIANCASSTGTVTVDPFSLVLLRYGENRRMT